MTHKRLADKSCIPCRGGIPPLEEREISQFMKELKPGWKVVDHKQLEKEFSFRDFKEALTFTNKIGALAEKEGHQIY